MARFLTIYAKPPLTDDHSYRNIVVNQEKIVFLDPKHKSITLENETTFELLDRDYTGLVKVLITDFTMVGTEIRTKKPKTGQLDENAIRGEMDRLTKCYSEAELKEMGGSQNLRQAAISRLQYR